jgi:ABC-type transport system involved in multi-copper enzyme maturation permease subunit
MRGPRAFITLTGVLIFLALISYALYQLVILTSTWSYSPLSPQIGQTLFVALVVLEMMMICLITPAVTAGAISSEHEKLTYEMLLTTPLNPTRILWGKLISSLSYIFLLVFAAVPIGSLVFIYGGVAPHDMLKALLVLVCTATMLGTSGIFMSTWLKRSGRATIASYLVVLGLLGVPTVVYGIIGIIRQAEPPRWLLVPSPISAIFSAIAPSSSLGNSGLSMVGGLSMLMSGNLGGMIGADSIPRPLYHYTLPLYGLITLVLYLFASRLIRPARRWEIKTKEIIIGLVAILVFIGAVMLAFGFSMDRYDNVSIFAVPTPFIPMPVNPGADQAVAFNNEPVEIPVTSEESLSFSFEETSSIYTAAILQVYTIDTPLPGVEISKLYLVQSTELADDPIILPPEVQKGITDSLENMPFKIEWIENFDIIPSDNMDHDTAIITFGQISSHNDDGSIEVMVDLFFNKEYRVLVTYILQKIDNEWHIIEFGGVG